MSEAPSPLEEISAQINTGEAPIAKVRDLLSWYGAYRRRWRNVETIRRDLDALNIETVPDFESPHIDTAIVFRRRPTLAEPREARIGEDQPVPVPGPTVLVSDGAVVHDRASVTKQTEPAHQISRLRSANTPPVSVKPDSTVAAAITLMLAHDYSQLPVMQTDWAPKGLFSWKSLGSRFSLGQQCQIVRECMDDYEELESNASLYDAIPLILRYECVLIRGADNKICGIVTPADIGVQFQDLAEPFLLLGAIENHLRNWISGRLSKEDLQDGKDPDDPRQEIEDVSDLTFGGYVRLLENPDRWAKMQTLIDRVTFVERLDNVRNIRNDVMHFDPDPMKQADLDALRLFAQLLERLEKLRTR